MLSETEAILAEIERTGLPAAIAKGTFADISRTLTGEPIEVDGPNGSVLYLLSKPVSVAHASGGVDARGDAEGDLAG